MRKKHDKNIEVAIIKVYLPVHYRHKMSEKEVDKGVAA